MNIKHKQFLAGVLLIIIILLLGSVLNVFAGTKTFPAGSYIIPVDPCWQPNNDPKFDPLYIPAYCDTHKEDQGIFQAYGMVYDLLTIGVPVSWIIKPDKTNQHDIDMSVLKSAAEPAVTIYHSNVLSDSGSLAQVDYLGGPFVVDINDLNTLDPTELSEAEKILGIAASGNIYTKSKLHVANYDFSAEVDKVLFGTPPKVAVLGEGATQVLLDYLMSAGLGNRVFDIFTQVTTPDIIAGVLDDFQLLWMPHWIITDEVPDPADRPLVISEIRQFLEAGNSGFFECASIESLEGSYDVGGNKEVEGVEGTGFLLDSNYTPPRIETNGGTQDFAKMVFEDFSNYLVQCGGWTYDATGGHVHNFRPNQGSAFGGNLPEPDYTYNSTVTRFIHDVDDEAITGYSPMGYDYYVGGRINGAATQGYMSYLGGHRYIDCDEKASPQPSARTIRLEFDSNLSSGTEIVIEVVHAGCIAGVDCPTADFSMFTLAGESDSDGTLGIDMDTAFYIADTVNDNYWLSDIRIINWSSSPLDITGINVTFESNPPISPAPILNVITDITTSPFTSVCEPYDPSPVSCPDEAGTTHDIKTIDLTFDSTLTNGTTIGFEAVYSGCTQGTDCPIGTHTIGGATTSANDGTISIDMSSTTYAGTKLSGIKIENISTNPVTIDQFVVTFPGNDPAMLSKVEDVTSTPQTLCTPDMTSPATCPPPGTATYEDKELELEFKKECKNDKKIKIEVIHDACTQGSCPKAEFTTPAGDPGDNDIDDDGFVQIDMTNANFSKQGGKWKLQNVILRNIGGADRFVERLRVEFDSSCKKVEKIKNLTDGDKWDCKKDSPADCDLDPPLDMSAIGGGTPSLNYQLDPPSGGSVSNPLTFETLGERVTDCTLNWNKSNTCGIRYVLNTLLGLQFSVIPNEYTKAQPIVEDNIVFKGTFEFPGYKGHLYAIDAESNPALTLWDAGANSTMPKAGSNNPAVPTKNNSFRYIFTNEPNSTTKIAFDSTQVTTLKPLLYPENPPSDDATLALINAARGRKDTSETSPFGSGEVSKRLGGIEHSTPAIVGRSHNIRDASNNIIDRDRIIYVGGHDGMLHAIHTGTWNSGQYDTGTGKEIWAYIPSSLLPSLKNQVFTNCNPGETINDCDPLVDPLGCRCPEYPYAVSVDSSPAVGDFFVDIDGDGDKEFRTILVATARVYEPGETVTEVNQGMVFALDVTDPYAPDILWERTFPQTISPPTGITRNYYPVSSFPSSYISDDATNFIVNMGNSKGTAIGRVQIGVTLNTYVFLTSRWISDVNGVWGLSAFALDFKTGDIVWSTKIIYTGDAEGVNETPPEPVLMDIDRNGTDDYVIFGDMQGRLWILRTNDGVNVTGGDTNNDPAFVVTDEGGIPTGVKEPIGAPVAVYREAVIFGTGGRDSLQGEPDYAYHIYGVGINPVEGAVLLSGWSNPITLLPNEKVWSPPLIDPSGNIFVATGIGYTEFGRPDLVKEQNTGRLLKFNIKAPPQTQEEVAAAAIDIPGAVVGGIDIENKHAYVVTFGGEVIQIGGEDFTPSALTTNPFRTLWWRKL